MYNADNGNGPATDCLPCLCLRDECDKDSGIARDVRGGPREVLCQRKARGVRRAGFGCTLLRQRARRWWYGTKNQKRSLPWAMSLAPETLSFFLPKMAFMRARKSGMRMRPAPTANLTFFM